MYFEYNSNRIYYEILGSGIPILTLHGFPLDHQFMKGSLEGVFLNYDVEGFQRIYFDFPGMGNSEANLTKVTSNDIVEIVSKFVEFVLPNKKFIIVGESYGAYIARALALKFRSRIIGMALVCPLINADRENRNVAEFKVRYVEQGLYDKLSPEDVLHLKSSLVIQTHSKWLRLKQEILNPLFKNQTAFIEKLGQPENYILPYYVDLIDKPYTFPSLFLLGRQDNTVGYKDAWKILDNFTQASFIVLNNAGHGLEIDQTALYEKIVAHWLDQVRG